MKLWVVKWNGADGDYTAIVNAETAQQALEMAKANEMNESTFRYPFSQLGEWSVKEFVVDQPGVCLAILNMP